MHAVRDESNNTPFEHFVATIDSFKTEEKGVRQYQIDQAREALLEDPLTAWALTYLSALRMRNAISNGAPSDYAAADVLARPLSEIAEEAEREKRQRNALKQVKSQEEKAAECLRLADEHFQVVAGCSLKSPERDALYEFLGPQMKLHHTLGRDLTVEILTEMLKTRDPNVLIPLAVVMVQACGDLDRACSLYDRWAAKRATVAKGERKLFGRKVDHAELGCIDQKLTEIRSENPKVDVRDIFREASKVALPVHEVELETSLAHSWANVGASLEDLAAFTHANLARLKGEQLASEPEKRDAVSRQADAAHDTGAEAMLEGSLLDQGDIDAWRNRQELR